MKDILNKKHVQCIRGFFCALLLLFQFFFNGIKSCAEEEELGLYATSAVLLDAESGRVLYEKNGYTPMAMASTTKIMTCILVLEQGELDDKAQVSAYAASMPEVKMYAKRGEEYEVRNLLYSLMLESHNDSAVVLAEYIGSRYLPEELKDKPVSEYTVEESRQAVKAFAGLMNQKAAELGCENTWFITPNGLDATEVTEAGDGELIPREHSTTAAELARIMAYCLKESPGRDVFREITKTDSYSFYENEKNVNCVNHNAFLHMMEGAVSGKTGFTNKAGYCYVGAVEDDGRTFVVALLACGWPNNKTYKWSDTTTLMNYGLDNFDYREIGGRKNAFDESLLKPVFVEHGQTPYLGGTAQVELEIAQRRSDRETLRLLMRHDEKVDLEYEWAVHLDAPVRAGTEVGRITYSVGGEPYLTETIVTKDSVDRIDYVWCVGQILERFLIL